MKRTKTNKKMPGSAHLKKNKNGHSTKEASTGASSCFLSCGNPHVLWKRWKEYYCQQIHFRALSVKNNEWKMAVFGSSIFCRRVATWYGEIFIEKWARPGLVFVQFSLFNQIIFTLWKLSGIQTHNLLIMSLLPSPIDQGSCLIIFRII